MYTLVKHTHMRKPNMQFDQVMPPFWHRSSDEDNDFDYIMHLYFSFNNIHSLTSLINFHHICLILLEFLYEMYMNVIYDIRWTPKWT